MMVVMESNGVGGNESPPRDRDRRWVPTERGGHLRGRRSTNTRPEIDLRRALHRRGFRFRLHRHLGPGCNPDIVLPRYRIAVWVDGCFWHGHSTHKRTPRSGPNADLWTEKIDANRARDRRAVLQAEELGWIALRVWECGILSDPEVVADQVAAFARR
jgi:DNA mismatch endonuclease (patch repair protein)